jgi:TonB family protein
MTNASAYGHAELQSAYQRHLLIGLLNASFLVVSMLAAYRLVDALLTEDHHGGPPIRVIDLTRYVPTIPHPALPPIRFGSPTARFAIGIPVPVPESDLRPDVEFGIPDDPNTVIVPGDSANGTDMRGEWTAMDPIPTPETFVPRESEPMPITTPPPAYPELARKVQLQGTVWVKAYIAKDGTVREALVQKSDAEIFNQPTLEAVRRWTFRPALMNNHPVGVWIGIPFRFRLQ